MRLFCKRELLWAAKMTRTCFMGSETLENLCQLYRADFWEHTATHGTHCNTLRHKTPALRVYAPYRLLRMLTNCIDFWEGFARKELPLMPSNFVLLFRPLTFNSSWFVNQASRDIKCCLRVPASMKSFVTGTQILIIFRIANLETQTGK